MSIELRQFQESEGLSDEQMAALLSERLDRAISVSGWRIMKGRKDAPAEWLAALSIVPQDPNHVQRTDEEISRQQYEELEGLKKPSTGILPFEPNSARMTITVIYTMAGRGAAAALDAPPVAEVWANYAPQIAEAYIEWAKESETVARIIAAATLGGPAGKVVLLHGSMLVTTLIMADRIKADMLMPPSLREEEGEEATSVADAFYPGGDDGDKPAAKPRSRARKTPGE